MLEHAYDDVVVPAPIHKSRLAFVTLLDEPAAPLRGDGALVKVQDTQLDPVQSQDAERVLQD